MRVIDTDSRDNLLDEKKNYNISYKTFIGLILLPISFDEKNGFIKIYGRIRCQISYKYQIRYQISYK